MPEVYSEFFRRITGNEVLPYQARYAEDPFEHTLLIVPTGLGKTDCTLMPWLFAKSQSRSSPRRLCLVAPRQNLTSQTAALARKRCTGAGLTHIRVLELMADSEDNKESLQPDESAIIVCTQDMYFSRALNRGDARRAPRWPIDFAQYNQDCLIVLDEIQLMDDALATSAQLAAFRERFGLFGAAPCVWMSATANPAWLRTVDFRESVRVIGLSTQDHAHELVAKRLHASKALAQAPEYARTPGGCAAFVKERHREGTRTLVITNTVARAREIFDALGTSSAVLLHSRFRPGDRMRAYEKLEQTPKEGQIVVSTQVLEAGIDLTSRLLVTDVAPWASLVQRFGRVNRYGEDSEAEIWWVDEPGQNKPRKDWFAPYTEDQVRTAVLRLSNRASAAPADLPDEDGPPPWKHVLRRSDLLDLFDTTPDLSGNELDVSRFIRATDERDVYLAWRKWPAGATPDKIELADAELCPVPVGDVREFARKRELYVWEFVKEEWAPLDRDRPLYPGMLLLARAEAGGYTETHGWMPDSEKPVQPVKVAAGEIAGSSSDSKSFPGYEQRLLDHNRRVMEELKVLLSALQLPESYAGALRTAAQKHDWGKVHPIFQETMHRHSSDPGLLAKVKGNGPHKVRHFRHELASALAMLQTGDSDLAAYLVAAHHGRIRMSIRSMPNEEDERVRGLREDEKLQAVDELAPGLSTPEVPLCLAVMKFGADGGSWTDRVLRLLDELGPFRLAYLEMVLRSADSAASANPKVEAAACTK